MSYGERAKHGRTPGGRKITRSNMNIKIVEECLDRCTQLHGEDCSPVPTKELDKIRLVDVQKRQIVSYPEISCDYVALSYVWGGVSQKSFKLGDYVREVPKTLAYLSLPSAF